MFHTNNNNAQEIINRRHKIISDYCKSKGWDMNDLDFSKILEIRKLESWKNVPSQVAAENS